MIGKHFYRLFTAVLLGLFLGALASPVYAVGTAAGVVISNTASVAYEDSNANALSATSNTVTTTVSQVAGVTIAPNNTSNAVPGDTVTYLHTVTNTGNGADTLDITVSSTQSYTVTLFLDVNDNGVYDSGTDTALADTDADATVDTGSLAADATYKLLVRVAVPAGEADGTVDTTTVTATSSFNTGVSASATDTTTVQAPLLGVTKSVSPVGDQPPGTTLTYTVVVDNTGASTASSIVLTDAIPTNTTYVPNSITLAAVAKTDASDGDEADFNVTTVGAVTVTIGTLAPAATATVVFQVTID